MLVSVLFSETGQVIGGALACDQLEYGQSFWNDVCGIDPPEDAESAVLDIKDATVVEALLNLQYDESNRATVDKYFQLLEVGRTAASIPSRFRAA
ncbi:MAG: hypothetical protein ABL888_11040 [Pirellulaceae bacterium]